MTEEKLDFKRILPIFVIVLVDLLGLTIIIPLMPLYAAAFGASAFMIGLLGAAYPAMQFIGAPLLGRLSDRYGRKPVLIVSQIGTFIGFIILALAGNLWVLFIARLVDGISGANIATAQAAISDSTTEKTRTQGLGLLGAAFGLGFIAGPIIAFVSLAVSGNDYRVPALVAAFFSLASVLLTTFWFKETLPVEARGKSDKKSPFTIKAMFDALKQPAVGLLLVLMFAQQIAFGGFEQFLALFTLNRLGLNASGNSLIFIFVGIIVVAVQGGLIGRWSRKYGDRKLVYAGLAILAIGLSMTAFTPRQPLPGYSQAELAAELQMESETRIGEHPTTDGLEVDIPPDDNKGWLGLVWILIAMIPASIGGGILQPSVNSLLSKRVEKDEVGGVLGISSAFLSGANAIAPLLMGVLFQAFGSTAPFLAGGLLMGLLFIFAVRMIRPGKEANAPQGLARGQGGH
ncbi:MAG: MFS transporter [Anaerolineales bacterium]|nr:MFS transporter [Anaerolineales bacterium]MCB8940182.1 MFS transporter [Ardenticatenaceae bacterium]